MQKITPSEQKEMNELTEILANCGSGGPAVDPVLARWNHLYNKENSHRLQALEDIEQILRDAGL